MSYGWDGAASHNCQQEPHILTSVPKNQAEDGAGASRGSSGEPFPSVVLWLSPLSTLGPHTCMFLLPSSPPLHCAPQQFLVKPNLCHFLRLCVVTPHDTLALFGLTGRGKKSKEVTLRGVWGTPHCWHFPAVPLSQPSVA